MEDTQFDPENLDPISGAPAIFLIFLFCLIFYNEIWSNSMHQIYRIIPYGAFLFVHNEKSFKTCKDLKILKVLIKRFFKITKKKEKIHQIITLELSFFITNPYFSYLIRFRLIVALSLFWFCHNIKLSITYNVVKISNNLTKLQEKQFKNLNFSNF